MKRIQIVNIIEVLFIILFLYTAISKLNEYDLFNEEIAISSFLAPIASFITPLIPLLEFITVILLIAPRWRLKGLYFSTGLMIVFSVYLVGLILSTDGIPCSCGE
ncbi:MauE/DoxX family redox-associated membrane protein [Paraflavitalea speifideaquila]|uniref:MauE/DoxX family redox-associated membrane protein n=1 Tax=Paraflavitalea speifideaquila TaxID=3076558 RepID=UPI0033130136